MKYSVFLFIVVVILSCSKSEINDIEQLIEEPRIRDLDQSETNIKSKKFGSTFQLTESEIIQIAEIHNDSFISKFNQHNFNYSISFDMLDSLFSVHDSLASHIQDFPELDVEEIEFNLEYINQIVDDNSELFIDTTNFKAYFDDLHNILTHTTSSLSTKLSELTTLTDSVEVNLTGDDLLIMKVAIEVGKSSMTLWSPTSEGGLGYLDIFDSNKNMGPDCTDAIAFADASAAATYIMGTIAVCTICTACCGAITATGTGLAAWLVAWGVSIAGASGWAAINCFFP